MPRLTLRDRILQLMQQRDYQPLNKSEFARALEVPSGKRADLRNELAGLERKGKIVAGKKGRFSLPEARKDALRGSIKFTPKGDAWFFPDTIDPDNIATGIDLQKNGRVYVSRRDSGKALNGDRVLASLKAPPISPKQFRSNRSSGGRPPGEEPEMRAVVEEILERRSGNIVGTYQQKGKNAWVRADDPAIDGNIELIGDTTARPGQTVVVSIENWQHKTPHGRIIEVLGWPGDAGVDILSIIHRNGIRTSFPDDVLAEARNIPDEVDPQEAQRREDWRDRLVITIDPADAKDHDDAIWVKRTEKGWKLAVHIADVSHYVKPRTSLDKEAVMRGNSTYLVDRVIPMLPVELSNGICSLKPDVDRLTKCAVLDIDRNGKVVKSRFCDALIHSQSKLSYEQAQTILDGGKAPAGSVKGLEDMVREAWKMASTLRKRRFANGALDLEMPEIRVHLGDDGKADRIEHVIHTASHQLIEECMLAANESVARILKIRNKPTIHRVHEEPDFGRLQEYGETAEAFGYSFGDLTNKKHIQQLLDAAKDRPDEHAIKIGLLKSLKRAAYSPDALGHYGLSKSDYCHFTSPIRRYADLIVHRSLQPFLDNAPKKADPTPKQAELADIARHISDTERTSADAENDSKQIKLLDYLDQCAQSDKPVVFKGLITEVRSMGLMVEATEISTRGVIKREDLPGGGPWRMDSVQQRLSGPGGKHFQLGQRIEMEVARIDHERRFVDFKIAGDGDAKDASPAPGSRGQRGKSRDWKPSKTGGGRSAKKSSRKRPKSLPHKRKRKK
ncbi:exoribonuclease R/ribonuclease II [Haloferula helveola]|uniref:Ribonuclease R n=1 Tax=Haloferula helveola TaxID=490095 RepID=A0ABN6H4C0_9BACT|nr:exoribonuclease R/ribonuclease II [Haloferula helveola]